MIKLKLILMYNTILRNDYILREKENEYTY